MNFIRIKGDINDIKKLFTLPEVDVQTKSATNILNDQWQLKAYCSESAISKVEALGLQVEVLVDDVAQDQHFAALEDRTDGSVIV